MREPRPWGSALLCQLMCCKRCHPGTCQPANTPAQVSALVYWPMGLNHMAKAPGTAGACKVTKKLKSRLGCSTPQMPNPPGPPWGTHHVVPCSLPAWSLKRDVLSLYHSPRLVRVWLWSITTMPMNVGANSPAVLSASTSGHTVSLPWPLMAGSFQWGPAVTPTHKPCTLAVPVPHQEGTSQGPAIARWDPTPNTTSSTAGCSHQAQVPCLLQSLLLLQRTGSV